MAINHSFLPQAQHKKERFIAKPLALIITDNVMGQNEMNKNENQKK